MVLVLLSLPQAFGAASAQPLAKQGVLDLGAFDIDRNGGILLDGEWEFYGGKLLTPDSFIKSGPAEKPQYLSAVTYWINLQKAGQFTKDGYGTYRLRVKVEGPRQTLALRTNYMLTAVKIWIDDRLVAERGTVGSSFQATVPDTEPVFVSFLPQTNEFTITMQTANFHSYWGGGGYLLTLTSDAKGAGQLFRDTIQDSVIAGGLVLMAFYNIGLWMLNRKRIETLVFSAYCFIVALRAIITGDSRLAHIFFPGINWFQLMTLEFLTVSTVPALICQFFRLSFPNEMGVFTLLVGWGVSAAYTLDFLLLSPVVFGHHLFGLQIWLVLVGILVIMSLMKAVVRKRSGAYLMLSGLTILFLAMVNDILYANDVIRSAYLIPAATLLFVFFQSLVMSAQFTEAYRRNISARAIIKKLNERLESDVEERTREISTIVDNVRSGFFSIGRAYQVQKGFTRSCNSILKLGIGEAEPFTDIFEFTPLEKRRLVNCFDLIFEDLMPSEILLGELATRCRKNGRIFHIEPSIIRDQKGLVTSILFTVNDVTTLVRMEEENTRNRRLLGILNHKESFRIFVGDVTAGVAAMQRLIGDGDRKRARVVLDALKNGAEMYELTELVELIQSLEEKSQLLLMDVFQIDTALRVFLSENQRLLGITFDPKEDEIMHLHKSQLLQLVSVMETAASQADLVAGYENWYRTASSLPVKALLGPVEETVRQLAARQNKNVRLSLLGLETLIQPQLHKLVIYRLIHLLKKAVDHGIEPSFDRGSKDPCGKLSVRFAVHDHAVEIVIEDDGRGLRRSELWEKALTKKMRSGSELSPVFGGEDQVIDLVFEEGPSMAPYCSPACGQDHGLNTLNEAVLRAGGTIAVESAQGRGTVFTILLPEQKDNLFEKRAA
jgi:signal transduction histidine kinase